MIDANSQFFAILTNVGMAKQANADALGIPWKLTEMGVGDANGTDPIPSAAQTSLINEWRRRPLNQLKVDPANAAVIIAEQVIPADEGGKWIREIGLYDADGDLVAVANCAPSFKPVLSQGSGRTQVVRMNFIVSSTGNITLKIDPAVVLATRDYVETRIMEELYKLDSKQSVRAVATTPIVLSGAQSIDSVAVVAGDRVLVTAQASGKDNGLWIVAVGAWASAKDADASVEVTPGLLVGVEEGAVYADTYWQLTTNAPIVLGVTPLVFELSAGKLASQVDAETGTNNTRAMTPQRVFQAIAKVVVQATEAAFGWAKVATQTQVTTGTDDAAFLTPKKLRGAQATQAEAETGTDNSKVMTPLRVSQAVAIARRMALFTSSGSWTCPDGVTEILLDGSGGGAGGAGANGSTNAGEGGGAGNWVFDKPLAVVPGQTYVITIASAGVGGALNADGTGGGVTSFGALLTLGGGVQGSKNGVGAGSGNGSGQAGGDAFALGGAGGGGFFGIGGAPRMGTGTNGAGYGAGGAGGAPGFGGGNGAKGFIQIKW